MENTLPVLDHCCYLGVSKNLEKQCWSIIDQHASEVVEHNQFVDIDHGTLTALLSRDTLVAKEMVLFRAAIKWAGRECQRLSIPLTVENKRRVLGDAFYSIRFPLMSMKEFTDEIAQSSFLSYEEVANMYIGYNSNFRSCNIRFPTEQRAEPAQETAFRCSRFETTALRTKQPGVAAQQCTVKFKVNQPITITGVALFTAFTQKSQLFKVELHDNHGSVLMSHNTDITKRDIESDIHDIFFPRGVTLQRDVIYFISVMSEDVLERDGEGLMREITCRGVNFEFLDHESDDEEEKGQIPELLFKPLGEGIPPASNAED